MYFTLFPIFCTFFSKYEQIYKTETVYMKVKEQEKVHY